MNDTSSSAAIQNAHWLLFVLNVPLLTEIVRRFLFQSDIVFIVGDLFVIGTFGFLFLSGQYQTPDPVPLLLKLFVSLFCIWIFIQQLVVNQPLLIFAVGARATFIPIVYLYVSAFFYKRVGNNGISQLYVIANIWIIIMGTIAIAQLILGIDHPINIISGFPDSGIGNYTMAQQSISQGKTQFLSYLFRPTSFFMHTGKFGQALFCLVLFKWVVLFFREQKISPFIKLSIGFDILIVLLSGQRGAILFLFLSICFSMLFFIKEKKLAAWGSVVLGVGLILSITKLFMPSEMAELVFGRMIISVFYDIPVRLENTLFVPLKTLFNSYYFMGEGFGYFTLGAQRFGGKLLYDWLPTRGNPENSYLRIIGELGVLGLIFYLSIYIGFLWLAWNKTRTDRTYLYRPVCIYFILWLGSIIFWANTHYIFANSVGMSLGFSFGGALLLKRENI